LKDEVATLGITITDAQAITRVHFLVRNFADFTPAVPGEAPDPRSIRLYDYIQLVPRLDFAQLVRNLSDMAGILSPLVGLPAYLISAPEAAALGFVGILLSVTVWVL
jgi:hypothetical protein